MLTLEASDTIAGVASAASEVTCTLFLMEYNAISGEEAVLKDQQQLASSVATIYTATANGPTFVRSIHVVNTDTTNSNTFQLFVDGTTASVAITGVMLLPPNGMACYEDGLGWQFFAADGGSLSSNGVGRTYMNGRGSVHLTAPYSVDTTVGKRIEELALVLPTAGTYLLDYYVVYESSLVGTGLSLGVNYTGTAAAFTGWMEFPSTGAAASTGAASMVASGATGQTHESFGFRANSTTAPNMGATVSVDAAGSAMLARICATLVATTGGRLELWVASETTAVTTIRTGTTLRVHRVN